METNGGLVWRCGRRNSELVIEGRSGEDVIDLKIMAGEWMCDGATQEGQVQGVQFGDMLKFSSVPLNHPVKVSREQLYFEI